MFEVEVVVEVVVVEIEIEIEMGWLEHMTEILEKARKAGC